MFRLFFLLFFCSTMLFCQNSQHANVVMERNTQPLNEALAAKGMQLGNPIFIRIFKESMELEIWVQKKNEKKFSLFKIYPICTYGEQGLGPKRKEGDRMAPEGFYYVPKSKLNPNSRFHLAFNLGYPNKYDEAHSRTGSALMVHGNCVSIGCYAMTDPGIEEIYTLADKALNNGQKYFKVHCFPFRLTDENMSKYANHQWFDFWKNLQEGYRYFEEKGIPPEVNVTNKKYVFE